MPFAKGQSGNPKGRPPKARALTAILERAGATARTVAGQKVAGKQLLARYLWDAALTGQLPFELPPDEDGKPAGRALRAKEWTDVVRFLYSHIDGPPKAELDVTSDGLAVPIMTVTVVAPPDAP